MCARARFGAGGNSDGFYGAGYKSSLDACEYLYRMGLNAYEYEATHGVRISDAFCAALGKNAKIFDVTLSIHAPYYINLASSDGAIREKSIMHLLKALRAADKMGAERVVFHPGNIGERTREEATESAAALLEEVVRVARQEGLLHHIYLCPETMGKPGQLGTLGEVLRLCEVNEMVRPTVDFAHIHALTGGGLQQKHDFERILRKIARKLGEEAVNSLHIHFSPIEFGKGGERRHRILAEKQFGPDFGFLAEILAEQGWAPTIICESAGTQDEDAAAFLAMYEGAILENSTKNSAEFA